jgi:predicted nicotinamide N-methyase
MSNTHVRSAHGILILERQHKVIRALGKAMPRPLVFGTQVWRSSFTMMSYLETHPIGSGCRVVEIGCGWGLAGIFCAKRFDARVLLTDVDRRVFPYARVHAALNGVRVATERTRLEKLPDQRMGDADFILGGDICFWPELETALRSFIVRALAQGVGRIVLADPGRSTFLRLANYCQERFAANLIPWRTETRSRTTNYLLIVSNPA